MAVRGKGFSDQPFRMRDPEADRGKTPDHDTPDIIQEGQSNPNKYASTEDQDYSDSTEARPEQDVY